MALYLPKEAEPFRDTSGGLMMAELTRCTCIGCEEGSRLHRRCAACGQRAAHWLATGAGHSLAVCSTCLQVIEAGRPRTAPPLEFLAGAPAEPERFVLLDAPATMVTAPASAESPRRRMRRPVTARDIIQVALFAS